MNIHLDPKNDILSNIKRRVASLGNREVKVGMFSEQGKHYSGYTYVELFKYLSEGDPSNNMPPRSPLEVVAMLVPLVKSDLKEDLNKYLSHLSKTPAISTDEILNNLGSFYREEVREVFGDEWELKAKSRYTKERSSSPNTPLIESGSLAKKVSYKVDNGVAVPIER
jgi:hypothetical protein